MAKPKLPKQLSGKIGRSFALLFNRAAMYNVDHPFTAQSITEFNKIMTIALKDYSPIVIIMAQDQFFVEEEPLDPRINTSKMLLHFKKTGIQSVSFANGMGDSDLKEFSTIFVDTAAFPNADDMKAGLLHHDIQSIRINHVFYKKVTADDEVVHRDELSKLSASGAAGPEESRKSKMLDAMIEKVMMGNFAENFSVQNFLDAPSQISQALIQADESKRKQAQAGGQTAQAGPFIMNQLRDIRQQVDQAADGMEGGNLFQLAQAAVKMKKSLIEGMEAQKDSGVVFENEAQIMEETEAITDQVIIKLIKDEYKKGKITISRLAQILKRLVPEPGEIKRLLPKLKKALLAEGMPPEEYLKLAQALEKELKNEELSQVLKKSAEKIGVSGKELIEEISNRPQEAAELIYLASEIRKGSGDEKMLSNLLVDYIERLGSKIALDTMESKGEEGGKHLKKVVTTVESQLLKRLKKKGVKNDVLVSVVKKLNDRFEECFEKIQTEWSSRVVTGGSRSANQNTSVLDLMEESTEAGEELNEIIQDVKASAKQKNIDVNDFQQLQTQIVETRKKHKESVQRENPRPESKREIKAEETNKEKPPPPEGVLNQSITHYLLQKEIARASRYGTTFSSVILTIISIKPKDPEKPLRNDRIDREKILGEILEALVQGTRDADLIGKLDDTNMIVILPMTEGLDSKRAMQRIRKIANSLTFEVDDIPVEVKCAAIVNEFDKARTPTLEDFVKKTTSHMSEMVMRLKNIQSIT